MNSYGYDLLGNMTSITQSGNGMATKSVTLVYDGDSRLTSMNCSDSNLTSYQAAYTYDGDSRLTDLVYSTSGGGGTTTPLAGYHWDYDLDSRVTDEYSQNDSSAASPNGVFTGTSTSNWGKTVYSYDHDSQLKGTTYSNFANPPSTNTSQTYDANGNRTNGSTVGAGNRLLSDGTYDYTYDADGNRIAGR